MLLAHLKKSDPELNAYWSGMLIEDAYLEVLLYVHPDVVR
jgi:hypothetical protein